MLDMVMFLKNNLAEHFVLYFIPLYILGGRPVSIISAQLLGFDIYFLLPVVVMLDTLQIPFFYVLFTALAKSAFIGKLYEKAKKRQARINSSRVFNWMRIMGIPGVVTVTMLPLKGCGMLSGFLLSRVFGLSKIKVYPLLIAGSILGCLLVFLAGEGILKFGSLMIADQ